jgi:hypothetical protein
MRRKSVKRTSQHPQKLKDPNLGSGLLFYSLCEQEIREFLSTDFLFHRVFLFSDIVFMFLPQIFLSYPALDSLLSQIVLD